MRADVILLSSCVFIGYGQAFQIANFLSSFTGNTQQRQLPAPYPDPSYPAQLEERQTGFGGDQIAERQSIVVGSITTIFVVFMISLITSIVTNIIFTIESIIPEQGGSEFTKHTVCVLHEHQFEASYLQKVSLGSGAMMILPVMKRHGKNKQRYISCPSQIIWWSGVLTWKIRVAWSQFYQIVLIN